MLWSCIFIQGSPYPAPARCSTLAVMQHFPGTSSDTDANEIPASGWVTTRVAAAALGVGPRRVRDLISEGVLESQTEGEGVNRRYLVAISGVEALRDERARKGKLPGKVPGNIPAGAEGERLGESSAEVSGISAGGSRELVEKLASELGEARYRLGRSEAQVELTAQTESTLREQLTRERERADRLEAELLASRSGRRAIPDEPGASVTASEGAGNGRRDAPGTQEPSQRRSWLYRFFFGP